MPITDRDRQSLYPALANKIYGNYGGQGPMSQPTLDAITNAYQEVQTLGPFGRAVNGWIEREVLALRQAIAQELHAEPSAIALTENVTDGCNIALWGLPWEKGDRILISDSEHPGVVAIIQELGQRFGVEVDIYPIQNLATDEEAVDPIAAGLTPRTKLVVLSHIAWNTGAVFPLKEIVDHCHRNGTLVLADAAQTVGMLPLNLPETGVDFYAFTGHKWLCGPAGVGGLYVSPDIKLRPTFIGWRSITFTATGSPAGYEATAKQYEVATSAYPLYVGLRTAIEQHRTWGTAEDRYHRICTLSVRTWEQLQKISGVHCLHPTPPTSGLISFQVGDRSDNSTNSPGTARKRHQHIADTLEQEHGILTRTLLNPSCIRICWHYLSTETDSDKFIDALRTLL
ncbi:MAG: aminotransferase class V-fold PLP-dependent enzyme [Cyanobacteria bacterium P01_C01_bin.89]